ncbi:MAG TPA: hypothetical protein DCS43_06230 [Verrucomicrobia bacterium]|nr:hypothetical protein [Verrucomicrobiota bacterium]
MHGRGQSRDGWLKLHFLYDFARKSNTQRVLACWNFKMLHPFVNDWLAKAHAGTEIGKRNPSQHPYSRDVLQWRIWNELCQHVELEDYATLRTYIGEYPQAMDRKRWGLAQRLAQLFDDYQNYRPELLRAWQDNKACPEACAHPENLKWQKVLWQALVKKNPETYLNQFLTMREKLPTCGINQVYRRISVFHTSAMPKAYMQFFEELAKIIPVEMFIFNPSQVFWIEDSSVKQFVKTLIKSGQEDSPEPETDLRGNIALAWMDPPHPILSGFGRGTQAFLANVLDRADSAQAVIHDQQWGDDRADTLLHRAAGRARTARGDGADGPPDPLPERQQSSAALRPRDLLRLRGANRKGRRQRYRLGRDREEMVRLWFSRDPRQLPSCRLGRGWADES